jgi:hypothetical protein
MLYRIEHIRVDAETFTIEITYTDKVIVRADFKPLIRQGGVAGALGDPALFATARIGPKGRSLVWSDDMEFCADGLRIKSEGRIEDAA